MFVQTGHFIEDARQPQTNDTVTLHGQEKSDTNTELARMNLMVHGLDASSIRQGNTFYDPVDHRPFPHARDLGACRPMTPRFSIPLASSACPESASS